MQCGNLVSMWCSHCQNARLVLFATYDFRRILKKYSYGGPRLRRLCDCLDIAYITGKPRKLYVIRSSLQLWSHISPVANCLEGDPNTSSVYSNTRLLYSPRLSSGIGFSTRLYSKTSSSNTQVWYFKQPLYYVLLERLVWVLIGNDPRAIITPTTLCNDRNFVSDWTWTPLNGRTPRILMTISWLWIRKCLSTVQTGKSVVLIMNTFNVIYKIVGQTNTLYWELLTFYTLFCCKWFSANVTSEAATRRWGHDWQLWGAGLDWR